MRGQLACPVLRGARTRKASRLLDTPDGLPQNAMTAALERRLGCLFPPPPWGSGLDAELTCDDGNGRVIFSKEIPYTGFPPEGIKLYYTRRTTPTTSSCSQPHTDPLFPAGVASGDSSRLNWSWVLAWISATTNRGRQSDTVIRQPPAGRSARRWSGTPDLSRRSQAAGARCRTAGLLHLRTPPPPDIPASRCRT
jgi:hypothetical protein